MRVVLSISFVLYSLCAFSQSKDSLQKISNPAKQPIQFIAKNQSNANASSGSMLKPEIYDVPQS